MLTLISLDITNCQKKTSKKHIKQTKKISRMIIPTDYILPKPNLFLGFLQYYKWDYSFLMPHKVGYLCRTQVSTI